MRRRNKNVVTWIIVILVIAAIAYGIYEYYPTKQSALDPGQTCYASTPITTSNSFLCAGTRCDVQGTATCNSQTGEVAQVTFRTNAKAYGDYKVAGTWFAMAGQEGAKYLLGYCKSGTTSGVMSDRNKIGMTITGNNIYYYNSEIHVAVSSSQTVIYNPCSNVELSTTPVEPYKSAGQEKYSGSTNTFICNTPVLLTTSTGTSTIETAHYEGATAGTYNTKVYSIQNGQKFEFAGNIKYSIVDDTKACTVSTCNAAKNGIFACTNINGCLTKAATATLCNTGESCSDSGSGAICKPPFDTTHSFVNSRDEVVTGYALNEKMYLKYYINSNSVSQATLTYELLNLDNKVLFSKVQTLNFPNSQTFKIELPAQASSGTYRVRVYVKYGDLSSTDGPWDVKVAIPFTLNIVATSDYAGTALYANKVITLELRALDDAGEGVTATPSITSMSIEGTPITNFNQDPNSPVGLYRFYVTVPKDGKFIVKGSANRLGYTATDEKEFVILPLDIRVLFTNTDNLQGICPGTNKVTFETSDPKGVLVDTTNTLKVITSSTGVTSASNVNIQREDTGKYYFNYPFDKEDGYKFILTSSASGYLTKEHESPFINVIKGTGCGTPLECTDDSQCTYPKVCTNNKCQDPNPPVNWLMYVAIIGGIIGLVIVVIVIFKGRGKSSSQVNPDII